MIQVLTDHFNTCPHHRQVPKAWKNALIVLIYKKESTSHIKHYRPICLLPIIYKVFSNIFLQRMIRTLAFHQSREQAGFRACYSTIDHLQVVNQLQEKTNEYKITHFWLPRLWNSFDSIEFNPLFEGLNNQSVDEAYLKPPRNLYTVYVMSATRHQPWDKLGRQKCQDWREYLSHLIFVDDIILITNSTSKLQEML